MVLHPGVQQKAWEEIDRVVGGDRLPTLNDRENLPYVEAVLKEVFRWHPLVPMGLPHLVTQDDVFEGYLIPKGAIIIPNIWFVPLLPFLPHSLYTILIYQIASFVRDKPRRRC